LSGFVFPITQIYVLVNGISFAFDFIFAMQICLGSGNTLILVTLPTGLFYLIMSQGWLV